VQDATASADLRLGAGKRVKAVRASSPASFAAEGPSRVFAEPLSAQLDRVFAAGRSDAALRPKSASLVFVRATVLGSDGERVVVAVGEHVLALEAPHDHPSLPYHENLRHIERLVGRELHVIGHVVPHRPRTLLAVTVEGGADAFQLPEGMNGRVNLGLDVLARTHVVAPREARVSHEHTASVDPLAPLRRRIVALALGGTRSLPPEARGGIDRERKALRQALMPGAADALGLLAEACVAASTERTKTSLDRVFVALTTYERAATSELQRATFV
jgi:hypothetical protein